MLDYIEELDSRMTIGEHFLSFFHEHKLTNYGKLDFKTKISNTSHQ